MDELPSRGASDRRRTGRDVLPRPSAPAARLPDIGRVRKDLRTDAASTFGRVE